MNHTDAGRLRADEKEKMLLKNLDRNIEQARVKNVLYASKFLNDREQALAKAAFSGETDLTLCFDGGFDGAERKILLALPAAGSEEQARALLPIACLRIETRSKAPLTHRECLGSLLGLGLARDVIGDILPRGGAADAVVHENVAAFAEEELTAVGRERVSVRRVRTEDLASLEQAYDIKIATVSSLRLDAALAAAYGVPRAQSQKWIDGGRAFVNHLLRQKHDETLAEGDVVSVRGKGRLFVREVGGKSRKNRQFVTFWVSK